MSGGKIIKFQQSQALTSHFESFWSIVHKSPNWALDAGPKLGPVFTAQIESSILCPIWRLVHYAPETFKM